MTVLYDEHGAYWAPVQDGPTGSHLDRDGVLFDELGDNYDDQETRYGVRDGFYLLHDADLDLVICPHLLSLACGLDRVDSEITRLHKEGYTTIAPETDTDSSPLSREWALRSDGGAQPVAMSSPATTTGRAPKLLRLGGCVWCLAVTQPPE